MDKESIELWMATKQCVAGSTRENGILVPEKCMEGEGVVEKIKDDFAAVKPQVHKTRTRNSSQRLVQVFDMQSIEAARRRLKNADRDQRMRLIPEIERAEQNEGKREIPKFGKMAKVLEDLEVVFPNFSEALSEIESALALATARRPADFHISPILMNGVPGIGKTAFAQRLADGFGLPFVKISAGGLQHAAAIVGTSSYWANTAPGNIFNLLSGGKYATGVVLLDEIDKLDPSTHYGILGALLELLEPESARIFKDVSMDVVFDASHLIILMTSNERDTIDEALLSRARIIEVRQPDFEQRVAIMNRWIMGITREIRKKIKPEANPRDVETLANSTADLRVLHRAIISSYGRALKEGSTKLEICMDFLQPRQQHRPIGFVR